MIADVLQYAYPHAKVRAMKGRLLSGEQFHALLNTQTYPEFLQVVKASGYDETFAGKNLADISITTLTQLAYQSLFTDYEKVIKTLTGEMQDFFILLYRKYEVINLKTILKGICTHAAPDQIAPHLFPTKAYTLFSKDTLLNFRDVHQLIEHLQQSFFAYPLNFALRRFDEEQEVFPLEMAIDLHYYDMLWKAMEQLPHQAQEIVREILGTFLDLLNIDWIIRFKEQYHFSTEEIVNYTVQHGYALKLRTRRQFSELATSAEMVDFLKQMPYGKGISGNESPEMLSITLNRYFLTRLQKYFFGNPFQIGIILSYVFLKEFEISDLLSIAEAKRYELPLDQAQHYIVNAMRTA